MAAAEEEENQHSETLLWAIHMCAPGSTYPDERIVEANNIAGASTASFMQTSASAWAASKFQRMQSCFRHRANTSRQR